MPVKRKVLAIGTAFYNTASDTSVVYDAIAVQKGELLTAYIRWESGDTTVTYADSAGGIWTVYKSFQVTCTTAIAVSWNHPGGTAVVVTASLGSSQGYRAGRIVRCSGGDVRNPVVGYQLYGADGVAPKIFFGAPPNSITFLAQGSFSGSYPVAAKPAVTVDSPAYSGFSYHNTALSGGRFHGHDVGAGQTAGVLVCIADPIQTPLLKSLPVKVLFPAGGGGAAEYTFAVSGGVSFAGSAAQLRTRIAVPSGGVAFAGTAPNLRTRVTSSGGAVTFSGTAPITNDNIYTITPSGGVQFSGAVPQLRERVLSPSGGVTFGGSARLIFVPVGGVTQQPTRIDVGVSRVIGVS